MDNVDYYISIEDMELWVKLNDIFFGMVINIGNDIYL